MWYHSSRVHLSKHQSLVFQVWSENILGETRVSPEEFLPTGFAGDRELVGTNGLGFITLNIEVIDRQEEEDQ